MADSRKDESKSSDPLNLSPPDGLSEEAVKSLADRFGIPDQAGFLTSFRSWATTYEFQRDSFRNVPTAAQSHESARALAEACGSLLAAIQNTGAVTIHRLRSLNAEELEAKFSEPELSHLDTIGAFSDTSGTSGIGHDLEGTVLRIELLKFAASSLAQKISSDPERFNRTQSWRTMDRDSLINNLRTFWENTLGRQFSCYFPYKEVQGSRKFKESQIAGNDCSQFFYESCRLIDDKLSLSIVEKTMKESKSSRTGTTD